MQYIGVDVGGTFTDLIAHDDHTGETRVAKVPSTPQAPDEGVLAAVTSAIGETLDAESFFLHGTTVGLNALLERRGATVGLLTTAGFRDALEIRRGEREDLMSVSWRTPEPLVPRRLRLEADERILHDGTVRRPLDEAACRRAAEKFIAAGVEAVAIVFLNAYCNPQHELAAERIMRDCGFSGGLSVSHRVSGEYGEYERTSTAAIDAFVRPSLSGYLQRLEGALKDRGLDGGLLVTRSGGGAMTFAEAAERPFETIQSGPVAGAVGAGELCRRLGISEAITADVGGTSFDTCLILDGKPQVKFQGRVIGMPVQTPWVDVRSVGSGGGSVAYLEDGVLKVGPRSAGAMPGPACYGRGGTEPTVTDAAARLGVLGFGELAGGMRLDLDAAEAALEPLASALSRSTTELAKGILGIVGAEMSNAVRAVSIEQGRDPREATLIVFGGAGPAFGCQLARELEIGRVLVPRYAGNFSAWGLLGQDLVRATARTVVQPLSSAALSAAESIATELFADLAERDTGGVDHGETIQRVSLDLRYASQEHTRSIPVAFVGEAITTSEPELREQFAGDYEKAFGHGDLSAIELVAVRATTTTSLPRGTAASTYRASGRREVQTVDAYSFGADEWREFDVVRRDAIESGEVLAGPLIVTEETTTTYVDDGFSARMAESGALMLTDEERA